MSWKEALEKSGLAASIAEIAVKAISDKVNKEVEEKYLDACAKLFLEHDRVDDLESQIEDCKAREKKFEAALNEALRSLEASMKRSKFPEAELAEAKRSPESLGEREAGVGVGIGIGVRGFADYLQNTLPASKGVFDRYAGEYLAQLNRTRP